MMLYVTYFWWIIDNFWQLGQIVAYDAVKLLMSKDFFVMALENLIFDLLMRLVLSQCRSLHPNDLPNLSFENQMFIVLRVVH